MNVYTKSTIRDRIDNIDWIRIKHITSRDVLLEQSTFYSKSDKNKQRRHDFVIYATAATWILPICPSDLRGVCVTFSVYRSLTTNKLLTYKRMIYLFQTMFLNFALT